MARATDTLSRGLWTQSPPGADKMTLTSAACSTGSRRPPRVCCSRGLWGCPLTTPPGNHGASRPTWPDTLSRPGTKTASHLQGDTATDTARDTVDTENVFVVSLKFTFNLTSCIVACRIRPLSPAPAPLALSLPKPH